MPRYKFVLKETPIGKADHGNHLRRRGIAVQKANVFEVHLVPPMPPPDYGVPETQTPGGDWCYTWVVDAPDMPTLWALIREFTRWGNVEHLKDISLLNSYS